MSNKILYSPKEGTTGFWFNGVEIVNGDEVIGQFRYHTNSETILNAGDLLDIPIGYEFKEDYLIEDSTGWQHTHELMWSRFPEEKRKKFLRLTKID